MHTLNQYHPYSGWPTVPHYTRHGVEDPESNGSVKLLPTEPFDLQLHVMQLFSVASAPLAVRLQGQPW